MSLKKDLAKFKPRKEQQECLDFIKKTLEDNPTNKFFLLNLPTGVGKSYLALMLSDFYKKNINKMAKIDIITNSKILQDQYSTTFNSISDLKGKENYECESYACSCAQGMEFNRLNKTSCESCPYASARDSFIGGGISLTNFYLYILYSIYNQKLMETRGARVLIVDECLHPDTQITLSDDSTKRIIDIKVGDLVKTINEESGDIEIKPVLKLHHNLNKGSQMYEIEMDNGDVLKITGNHKVKLIDGTWKKVEDLTEDDFIICISNKTEIKSIKKIDYIDDVYNLHIEDNHNYFANNHCVSNCHEFDDVMSNFISIKITDTIVKRLKFSNEKEIIRQLKGVKTILQYVDFLKYLNEEIITTVEQMESGVSNTKRDIKSDKRDLKISKILKTKNSDVKVMNIISDLKQYQLKIDVFLKEYKENPNNWVLESSYNEKLRQSELSLEPIWSYDYLDKYVFNNYDMVFLMSGTILDKNLFCSLNGLDVSKTVYYSIPSPFAVKNRPIYYMPIGKMSFKSKEETFKRYVPYIKKLLEKYKNKKGIIHTNSFELSKWIQESIKDPRLIFHDSSNKDEMLKMHFESNQPTVLVSPSVSVGVSFDNDSARFQIIAKMPYKSLASQKNKMRQINNPDWYSWAACCELQQTYGRICRSDIDYGDTIILDAGFGDVMKYSSSYLASWFQDAIKKINVNTTTS
jgi:Rad3-related DNA helicase